MKDVLYVLFAVIGLLLVALASAVVAEQIQARERAKARANTIEAKIAAFISGKSCCPDESKASLAGAVPTNALFCAFAGYLLQMIGCAFYARRRGRSVLFGLLGLLSPIGYVFLALLNPATSDFPS